MDLTFRSETVSSYGIFYSYDHPATLGIMVYVKDGKFTIENMPIAEFNAAMEEAEA